MKKIIRKNFKNSVFERDNYTCQICGYGPFPLADDIFDAHHITDRSEMPNGGYVKENGITVCKVPKGLIVSDGEYGLPNFTIINDSCHLKCEKYHLSGGLEWEEGLHPDDLYKKIGSTKEEAIEKSKKIN